MITFERVPGATLNPKTGQTSGITPAPQPANIGMPTPEFHQQVIALAQKKIPLEQVNQAIDQHSDITDKPTAKSMAEAVYNILGNQKK